MKQLNTTQQETLSFSSESRSTTCSNRNGKDNEEADGNTGKQSKEHQELGFRSNSMATRQTVQRWRLSWASIRDKLISSGVLRLVSPSPLGHDS